MLNQRAILALLIALFPLAMLAAPAQQNTTAADAADAALEWMTAQQNADGSFTSPEGDATIDAVLALTAAGEDVTTIIQGTNSPLDYLAEQAGSFVDNSTTTAGKLTLALVAAGENPRAFGGRNLINIVARSYDQTTGRFGESLTDHAYALLARSSTGQSIPDAAVTVLEDLQRDDGGWNLDGTADTASDTNTTALVIQALLETTASADVLDNALAYLRTQQNNDGGFPYSRASASGAETDATSTAMVIQALLAADEDPNEWQRNNTSSVAALLALQNDSGAFAFQASAPQDSLLATAQVIPVLLEVPLPTDDDDGPQAAQQPPAYPGPETPTAAANDDPYPAPEEDATRTPTATPAAEEIEEEEPETTPTAVPDPTETPVPEPALTPEPVEEQATPRIVEETAPMPPTSGDEYDVYLFMALALALLAAGVAFNSRSMERK